MAKEKNIIEEMINQLDKEDYSIKELLKILYKNGIILTDEKAVEIINKSPRIRKEISKLLPAKNNLTNTYQVNEPNDENLKQLLDAYASNVAIIIEYEETDDNNYETYNGSELLFQSINSFPLLTDEQFDKLYQEYKNGSSKARDTIICSNQKLALKIANQYAGKKREIEDLFAIGVGGLIIALDLYDPTKNSKFATYATWHIRKEIEESIRRNEGVYRVSHDTSNKIRIIKKCIDNYYAKEGKNPSIEVIQKQTGYSLVEIKDALEIMSIRTISINDQIKEEGENTFDSIIKDEKTDIVKEYEDKELIEYIIKELYTYEDIVEIDIDIIKMRLGIEYSKEYTLEEVGEKYGITRERVRQIQNKVVNKIKLILSDNYQSRINKPIMKPIVQPNIPLFSIFITKRNILSKAVETLTKKEINYLKLKYSLNRPTYKKELTNEEERIISRIINKIQGLISYYEKNEIIDYGKAKEEDINSIKSYKQKYHSIINDILGDLPTEIEKKYRALLTKKEDKYTKQDIYCLLNIIIPYLVKHGEAVQIESSNIQERIKKQLTDLKEENITKEILEQLSEEERKVVNNYIKNKYTLNELRYLGNVLIPKISQLSIYLLKELNHKFKTFKFLLMRSKSIQNELEKILNEKEINLINKTINSMVRPSIEEINILENNIIPVIKRLINIQEEKNINEIIIPNIFELMENLGHDEMTVLEALSYLDEESRNLLCKGYSISYNDTTNYNTYTQGEKIKVKNQIIPSLSKMCFNIENGLPATNNINENRITIRERLRNFDDDIFDEVYSKLSEEDKELCKRADNKEQLTPEEDKKRGNIVNKLICQAKRLVQVRNNLTNNYSWNSPIFKKKK